MSFWSWKRTDGCSFASKSQKVATRTTARSKRRLRLEALEGRALMAGDLAHNFLHPVDVNDDGRVTPLDALHVINRLNRSADDSASTPEFHDVNDDSNITPMDALWVINDLNQHAGIASAFSSTEYQGVHNGVRFRLEYEVIGTTSELSLKLDGAPASQSYDIKINGISLGTLTTDSRGRGKLELRDGDDRQGANGIPASVVPLTAETLLMVGDLFQGKLGDLGKLDDNASGTSGGSTGGSTGTTIIAGNWVASFTATNGLRGSAEYEVETERGVTRKLKIEVERAAPQTSVAVVIAGKEVGNILVDARGKGKLILSTQPKGVSELPFPADFPSISEGTELKVGSATTTFRKALA
ncbi:MAG: dockerin type I domain-containing protein [Pirellulales bacterium]